MSTDSRVVRVASAGAGVLFVRACYELYRFRAEIESNVDYDDALPVDGVYGAHRPGDALVFGVMGDSLVCGKGASRPEATVTAAMARGLAEALDRPVRLVNVARSGGSTRHLEQQTRELADRVGPGSSCDLVFVSVGAIDVANCVAWGVARADIRTCVHDLTRTGAKVVFSMPDAASVATSFGGRPMVSAVCDALMRRRARKQRVFLEEFAAHGYHVRAADFTGVSKAFEANTHFTSGDRMHPSDAGQAAVAVLMVPQLLAALRDQRPTHPGRARVPR